MNKNQISKQTHVVSQLNQNLIFLSTSRKNNNCSLRKSRGKEPGFSLGSHRQNSFSKQR